jgi:predicted RNA binding protein YcfA (HicA-like mRNA interferase family)
MMNDYSVAVKKLLSKHDWKFYRHGKGSHDMWISQDEKMMVAVPKGIKSRHTANDVLKRAGLKERIR